MNEDVSKIEHWNSGAYPVRVNSIRYNQDYSLFTLGTSKGYRIFLTKNLKSALEETEAVRNLGDLNIVMTYYKSSLVFFLPGKNNPHFSTSELVVFDDLYQSKFASFKVKSEEISNFFVSKNVIYVTTLSQIIILEILTFKVIDIIETVNTTHKLISFNFYDIFSYMKLKDKKTIYTKILMNDKHKVERVSTKIINSSFNFIQLIQLSPNASMIAVVSIFGNKIHLYYTQTSRLKECIYLGNSIMCIEKLSFSKKKENYILIMRNNQKFYIYKTSKNFVEFPKCVCSKYDDKNLTKNDINQDEENTGWLYGFFKKNVKNNDIRDVHAFSQYMGNPFLIDFEILHNKDLIIIDRRGKIEKFHFNKQKGGEINPFLSFDWI